MGIISIPPSELIQISGHIQDIAGTDASGSQGGTFSGETTKMMRELQELSQKGYVAPSAREQVNLALSYLPEFKKMYNVMHAFANWCAQTAKTTNSTNENIIGQLK